MVPQYVMSKYVVPAKKRDMMHAFKANNNFEQVIVSPFSYMNRKVMVLALSANRGKIGGK